MYTSNSQNHQVTPHHALSPMQAQSIPNPHYMSDQTPPAAHPSGTAPPPYLRRKYPDNRYHPQEVFLGHDGWRHVRQYDGVRYPAHPMDAPPDTPIKDMYPPHHVGVPHSQPASVRQSHSVVQSALDASSTMASTQQFLTSRISGNVTNDTQPNATLQAKEEQDALRALIHVRWSATSSERDAPQSGPCADAQSAPANISPTSRNRHVHLPVRNRTSDWPTITSTNSGSGALMHGAIVGHSDGAVRPPQKRRKRYFQHHHC